MQILTPELIAGKKVLLRMDLDVPIKEGVVVDDFRLQAALPTIDMCLEHAETVTVMGHIGRPGGKEVPSLSVEPIYDWLAEGLGSQDLGECKLRLLENLRFERGESFDTAQDETAVSDYARELAKLGDFYVNEAFAAFHPAASTTVLPTLLPHAAGLRFAQEVEKLTQVLENPKRPLVAIIGGAKVEDKLPVIQALAKLADVVLVGGKLAAEISTQSHLLGEYSHKIVVAKLNEDGTDITPQTTEAWKQLLPHAKMVIWNGPLGKVEDPQNDQTRILAQAIIDSEAESIIGGGDTVAALDKWDLLDHFSFVSTGGGAMWEFLSKRTLPTIEALM
ncbi:MAG: phosphoglycerate kinase [bacterium]|nr:phosphoglycerate kinase [bacterium]